MQWNPSKTELMINFPKYPGIMQNYAPMAIEAWH